MHVATVNGEAVTEEILALGYSKSQLSNGYHTYDVVRLHRTGLSVVMRPTLGGKASSRLVTSCLISRLDINYNNGDSGYVVTGRSWRTALGPHVTDAWYSGSGFDAPPRLKDPRCIRRCFANNATGRFPSLGNNSTDNATQTAQALAFDAGLVPEGEQQQVLDALVELAYNYTSNHTKDPHLSGGTLGLGAIVRALSAGGCDDVLWESLQQNDQPSYGYFKAPIPANPQGFTTIGGRWNEYSKNHMILAQIDEWFHAGTAGIQPTSLSTISKLRGDGLVFHPAPVGDLQRAKTTYKTLWGKARSAWNRIAGGAFTLTVTVHP
ncbi:alpha-rhamnosidase [Stagonosporopsis vannaccii]|nr:alpha-rhamnosidase [Stagonosporopsis vannaccii]